MAQVHLLKYFIREAVVNMTRNKLLNVIAIGMIGLTLAIFGIFWLIYSNVTAVANQWTDTVQIIAYLGEDLSDEQQTRFNAQLREMPSIDEVTYVSRDAALQQFKTQLHGHEELLEGIEENPLPASYEIRLHRKYRNLSSVETVVEKLQQLPHITDIQYGQKWLKDLATFVTMLKFIGIFLGSFLFFTVIFIIANTIKLALYTREEELTIMKFVGATENFIKGPFLAEGIIRGFLGAVLALTLLYLLKQLFVTLLHHTSPALLSFSSVSFLSWTATLGIIVLGSFLGWCGSLLTLHKFLKTY